MELNNEEFNLDDFLNEEYKHIPLTKQGKSRKRKPKEPRIYFTQDTEDAIIEYLATEDTATRNKIYNERISYAFYKLAENIIHTFKFYYTDSDTIEELKHEVIAFLLVKLHLYKQEKGKAYSYFGTIAKRYLIVYNENNYKKLQEMASTDEINEDKPALHDSIRGGDLQLDQHDNDPNAFIDLYVKYMDIYLSQIFPKTHDLRTADAIVELFRKREHLEIFNKKAIYIYIREIVDVSTPQITKIIKKLKNIYIKLYNEYYDKGFITYKY